MGDMGVIPDVLLQRNEQKKEITINSFWQKEKAKKMNKNSKVKLFEE